jgi:PAS domain S-box-containing protein
VQALPRRALLPLLAVYLATLAMGQSAANLQSQALAVDQRAHRAEQTVTDIRVLQAAVVDEAAGLRGYVLTAKAVFLSDYDLRRSQAEEAWSALAADAAGSRLEARLSQLKAALDAWQAWASQRQQASAPAAPARDGDSLLDAVLAAAGPLERLAGVLAVDDRAEAGRLQQQALIGTILGSLGGAAPVLVSSLLLWVTLRPVASLAKAGNRLAAGLEPAIPYADRGDEVGAVARALVSWRQTEASQRAIWLHTPVGMLTFGLSMQIRDSNPANAAMFGYGYEDWRRSEPGGRVAASNTHPDDMKATREMYRRLLTGESEHEKLEKRFIRKDGSVFWGGVTVGVVQDVLGNPSHYVCIVEDVTERKERMAYAAQVQQSLLPDSAPHLEGYELTGRCEPAEEVGGDFFDWYQPKPGTLTLTLADVAGKGMSSAILMAMMRSALRASSWMASVAETVQSVADLTISDLERAGAFLTLFHARLDLETGLLSYVDPQLDARDAEMEAAAAGVLHGGGSIAEMAERLTTNPQSRTEDDVTVVVLRRL